MFGDALGWREWSIGFWASESGKLGCMGLCKLYMGHGGNGIYGIGWDRMGWDSIVSMIMKRYEQA